MCIQLIFALLQIHYLDPEDLLQFGEQEGLLDIPSLPGHFEQNRRLLSALQSRGISHRYDSAALYVDIAVDEKKKILLIATPTMVMATLHSINFKYIMYIIMYFIYIPNVIMTGPCAIQIHAHG